MRRTALPPGLCLVVACLTGCSTGPDYAPPQPVLPAAFAAVVDAGGYPVAAEDAWWLQFVDPTLTALVERAMQSNLDLAHATAVLNEARALRGRAAASFFPSVDGVTEIERRRLNTVTASDGFLTGEPRTATTTFYEAGFDSAWELDLFGRTARAVESADAAVEAEQYARAQAILTVAGEVSRAYIEACGLQQRVLLTRRTVAAQTETLDLVRSRTAAGTGTGFDVIRAEAQLAAFAGELPPLEVALFQTVHRLAVLTGQLPEALLPAFTGVRPVPVAALPPDPGLPAALLRRRPDVAVAERRLAQASADIGVAVADLYPRVTLPGSVSIAATRLLDLLQPSSLVWTIGAQVSVPLLDGGARRAEVDVRRARYGQAQARFQQTVLRAVQEVEDALVAYTRNTDRRSTRVQQSLSASEAARLAAELHARGLVSFLDVLDANRDLYRAETELAIAETDLAVAYVALCKASGGGWATRSTTASQEPAPDAGGPDVQPAPPSAT